LATAFDDLLASFTDEGDRQALEGLAAKNPNLKDSVLRQSDYSRKLNEFKAKETQLDQWTAYAAPKRQAAERAKFEAELKQTRDDAEARIKAIEEQKTAELDRIRALSSGSGHSPADMSGAEMGGFQRSYQQLDRTNSEGKPLAPEIGLGEGGIAEFAAEQFVRTGKVGR
jgi:hypothetical protein